MLGMYAQRTLLFLHDDRIDYEQKMSFTKIVYDPDGWMMTDNNEIVAVARDSSYKEIVRHGKSMVSLIVAEIYKPPIMIVPYYERKDPLEKKVHGPHGSELNRRKRTRVTSEATHRNRNFKILSRQKKHHPKYIYQRLSPVMEEEEMKTTPPSMSTPPPMDDINTLRIRIPPHRDEEEEEHYQDWEEEELWDQVYREAYFAYDRW